ncbi:MAG: CBASS cGAMP-activated phospholipase [Gemmataceae bacterium]
MFRILTLDGGGIMGAFTASVLASLEKATGRRIADHFDLIAGTSTGGLIAIALGMGKSASEIQDFYRIEGPKIFPSGGFLGGWLKRIRHLFGPKFSSQTLRSAIEGVVGSKPLGESRCRLVIPAYDIDQGRVYLFKTAHHPRFQFDVHLPAVDVALATSAAPTYFPAHEIKGHGTYIDGGVWANCPIMVGLTEAVNFLGWAMKDIHLLSISTTSYPFRLSEAKRLGGILNWNATLIETLMFGQEQGAVAEAACFLKDRFHRITYLAEPGLYALDNASLVEELIRIGVKVAEKEEHLDRVVRPFFLNGSQAFPFLPVTPNPPELARSGPAGGNMR